MSKNGNPLAKFSAAQLAEFIIEAMKIFDGFGGPADEELWWRTDEEHAPVTLFANVNDVFFWGAADCEELTPEKLPALKQAAADMRALGLKDKQGRERNWDKAHWLWVARLRGMRPQGAIYKYIDKEYWPLFDACGPERKTGFGNPKKQGD